ncbi:MAG: hypothetical protein HFE78_08525 [Clostridiales bacterium]|nr:hypothetical protein [Clostridiales bacterium]
MDHVVNINGITCYEENGIAYLQLEAVARGLGFTTVATSGNEVVRWNTVHKYLTDLSVATSCNGSNYKDCCPDFIPENIFYRLAMKAKNEAAENFQAKIANEILPALRKTGSYSLPNKSDKSLEIKEANARVRLSNQFLKLSKVDTLSNEYKNILVSKAAEVLTDFQLIPLPKSEQKMYTATEIGDMFGVTPQRIGIISNQYNMKNDEYGAWYRSKSQYSNKEVDSFMYNDRAVDRFGEILG